MKIKINSDNKLPLNKTLKIPTMTIVIRAVFDENMNMIHKFSQMNVCNNYTVI